jgi:hypothetical protein
MIARHLGAKLDTLRIAQESRQRQPPWLSLPKSLNYWDEKLEDVVENW